MLPICGFLHESFAVANNQTTNAVALPCGTMVIFFLSLYLTSPKVTYSAAIISRYIVARVTAAPCDVYHLSAVVLYEMLTSFSIRIWDQMSLCPCEYTRPLLTNVTHPSKGATFLSTYQARYFMGASPDRSVLVPPSGQHQR